MLIAEAYAQTPSGGAGGMDIMSMLPIILMFVLLYFLLLRPQMKRAKEQKQMIASLQKGDEVVTSGGALGKVTKVDDQELQVEIADGVRVKVVRGTVSEVRGKGEAQPGPKSKAAAAEGDK
jgi:preprotein translocase subunit YajC